MKREVAVLGALSLDTIRFHDGRIFENVFGGSAGYAALASNFFARTHLVSTIGEDYPSEFLENLQKKGISTEDIEHSSSDSSTHFSIRYNEELREKAGSLVELNILRNGLPVPSNVKRSKYIYIASNKPSLQSKIIDKLDRKSERIIGISTHIHWITEQPEQVLETLQRADIVFLKDNEMCLLTQRKQLRNAAKALVDRGISTLVVRKGEHGAMLFRKDRMFPFIAYDRLDLDFVDPTGCGGVLAGTFLGFLAECEGTREKVSNAYFKALAFGLVVRSFKIEELSYERLLTLTKNDIWSRYDQFRDMFNK